MISVHLRDKNHIFTLSVPGKMPIRSTAMSSYSFWNSNELLAASIATCISGTLYKICLQEKINLQSFESLNVHIEDKQIKVVLQHPKEMDKEILEIIKKKMEKCDIKCNFLKSDIVVMFIENDQPLEKLVSEKRSHCCGG